MQRLIDADALEALCSTPGLIHVAMIVKQQPTIDAVPKEKILLFLNIANEELSKAHANKSANGIMTWSASVTTLEGLLKEYDTADTDIVTVIRCRDCKHGKEDEDGLIECTFWDFMNHTHSNDPNGFCFRAEPKETE